jgi:hypothetical protein
MDYLKKVVVALRNLRDPRGLGLIKYEWHFIKKIDHTDRGHSDHDDSRSSDCSSHRDNAHTDSGLW